jgi:tetratricopeptide (TPR) repeat protein
VRHVVEGSVRKSGDAIRVTAQLIDSSNDKHLWSDTYDRPLTTENIFIIQDEIASSIVAALSDALGVGSLEPIKVETTTRNLDAYDLYLRVRPMFHARTDLDVADELIARAVELDPQFAKAWEIRAALQLLAREYGYSAASVEESEERGDEFARRALQIEPRSATALAVLAKIDGERAAELRGDINVSRVIDDLSRALEIEPRNASALNWRGLRYLMVGEFESALDDFTICMEYEPYYRPCIENYYSLISVMGKDEESILAYLDALSKGSVRNEFAYLPVLARLGNELAFKIVTNDHFLLEGWHRHDELWDAYNNPDDDHSDLIESMRGYLERREGGYENAFSYLAHPIGKGWRIPDSLVIWDPMMSGYRQTEPFKKYMREAGVLDYWREAGFPPQCRLLDGDDFECD